MGVLNITVKGQKKHQDGSDRLSWSGAAWRGTRHLSGLIYEQADRTAKEISEASTNSDPRIETAMEMVSTPKPRNAPSAYDTRRTEDVQLQNHADVPREHQHLGGLAKAFQCLAVIKHANFCREEK